MSKFLNFIGKNRPTILTIVGAGGLIATAVMAYKSWPAVHEQLYDNEEMTKKEKAWVYVKTLWPTFTLGAVSTAMVVLGNRDHLHRTHAALAAYYISESTLKDYQEEMIKELGDKQATKIRDKVNEKRMNDIPANDQTIIVSETDAPWVCDTATGCYFRMSYEKLRRVMAEANLEMFKRDYISVADLYDGFEVELPPGQDWWMLGWSSRDGDIEYWTTSAIREIQGNKVPCMVLEYRVKPHYDFDRYG